MGCLATPSPQTRKPELSGFSRTRRTEARATKSVFNANQTWDSEQNSGLTEGQISDMIHDRRDWRERSVFRETLEVTKHSSDSESKRVLPVQQTIGRIVQSFANMSVSNAADAEHSTSNKDEVEALERSVHDVICAWQARASYFPGELLSDPVWGMLLELFRAELGERPVSLSTLCKASAVPGTTALRCLEALAGCNLIVRRPDHRDAGNQLIELTPEGSAALHRYFRDVITPK